MSPDQLKALFDMNAVLIMFVWGLIHKYAPTLARIPNSILPWVNVVGYILMRLVGGEGVRAAHAGGFINAAAVPALVSALIPAFANSAWASVFYERFARPVLEGWMGWKKAEVKVG